MLMIFWGINVAHRADTLGNLAVRQNGCSLARTCLVLADSEWRARCINVGMGKEKPETAAPAACRAYMRE